MGLLDFLRSDRQIFIRKIKSCEKCFEICRANPFSGPYSINQISKAQSVLNETKKWWLDNRQRLSKQDWMDEETWHETNKAFGIPSSAF